jgi:hypothetical protein
MRSERYLCWKRYGAPEAPLDCLLTESVLRIAGAMPISYMLSLDQGPISFLRRLFYAPSALGEDFPNPPPAKSSRLQAETNGGARRNPLQERRRCVAREILYRYEKLASSGANYPLIFITAQDNPQWQKRAAETDAVAYLRKPFDQHSLLDALHTASSRLEVVATNGGHE